MGTLYAQADLTLDLFAEGHFEEGRVLAGELVPMMRKVLGATDRRTLNAISNIARCEAATGRTREAIALLYRVMSLLGQGKTDAARQLYSETIRTITPPPSAEHPLLNNSESAGNPIIVWLAQREAQSLLDQTQEDTAPPKNAPGQK